ncbi:AhpC/TSA family protein [Pedobacter sp. HDW13]|uniref:TlpA disulfide reductase family protein n=1 Tax=Pedobacter sp. HDW13 TaxID=2714940 RepID=UPI00140E12F9|nr:TlpA disulfide reductase family protein [Pedobacter sp. HDW13]QIL37830.1 AhpC/TSA family protein [Pedobacter sp. HDW13]
MNTILKKINLSLFGVLCLCMSLKAQSPAGYILKGTTHGIKNGKVYLSRYNEEDRTSTNIDSTNVINGAFIFKGKLASAEQLGLNIKPGNWSANLFLENGTVNISIDTAGADHYDYTKYGQGKGARLKKVIVKGSRSQDQLDALENNPALAETKSKREALDKQYTAEKNAEKKEALKAAIGKLTEEHNAIQFKLINQFISQNPSAVSGVYAFGNYYKFNSTMPVATLSNTIQQFKGEAKTSSYYISLAKQLKDREALLPGNIAPDFTLLKRDSTKLSLSDLSGKYVMIDFWASWCKPCREAIPHWKQVYEKYHNKGFEILSVSDDSKWNDWIKAMDIEQMPWPQVIDEFPKKMMPARVGSMYQVHFIPFYVLLDKEGKILVYGDDEKIIDAKLAALLGS